MSELTTQFLAAAGSGSSNSEPRIIDRPRRITYEGQSTFVKFCPVCHEQMPHIRREDYSECVLCGNRTYARGNAESG